MLKLLCTYDHNTRCRELKTGDDAIAYFLARVSHRMPVKFVTLIQVTNQPRLSLALGFH